MVQHFRNLASGVLAALTLTMAAYSQPPAPATPAAPVSSAVANPSYQSVSSEITVNRPAAELWARVGKYCDIGEWAQFGCTLTSGNGELGTVRSVGAEILVGKTEYSYTYTQPVRDGRAYNMYHGTLEVRPVNATTSKIVYSLVWDNSMLADDAARERDKTNRTGSVTRWVQNMKTIAEGGTLPPPPARGGGRGASGAPPAGPGR